MGLLELVKRQINITSEKNLKIEYIKTDDISDILKSLEEDFIIIKRDLTLNDAELISCCKGTVFTTKPKTLNSLDAVKKLEENKNIKVIELKNIGLNFIRCGEILYAFSEIHSDSETPNVLKIYPVNKKIFEENVLVQNNNSNTNIEISDNAGTIKHDFKPNIGTEIKNENHEIEKHEAREKLEKNLIRKELFRIFNEKFTVIRIEFWGDIEDKKIGLTRFYNRHGISKGQLVGSWKLFDKVQLNTALDKGLKKKIIDDLSQEFSISLGVSYGKIIHNEHKEAFKKRAEEIEKDYIDYLKGVNKNNFIGNIKIRVAFNPDEAIENSRKQLTEYLKELKPSVSSPLKYDDDVKNFVGDVFADINDFASKVTLKKIFTNFTEDQWEDDNFIKAIVDASNDEKNKNFFTEEFTTEFYYLLKRLGCKES